VTGSQGVKGGTHRACGGTHARQAPLGPARLTQVRCSHLFPGPSTTVYAGQRLNHRESGGTADAPDLGSGARQGVGVRLSPLAPPLTWESPFPDSFEQAAERTSCSRLPTEPAGVAASRGSCDGLLHSDASSRCRNLCRSSSPVASVCLGSTRLRSRLRRSSGNREVAPLSLAQQQHHSGTADAAHGASVARPADGRSLCAEGHR
jgi:hypothetical protein